MLVCFIQIIVLPHNNPGQLLHMQSCLFDTGLRLQQYIIWEKSGLSPCNWAVFAHTEASGSLKERWALPPRVTETCARERCWYLTLVYSYGDDNWRCAVSKGDVRQTTKSADYRPTKICCVSCKNCLISSADKIAQFCRPR